MPEPPKLKGDNFKTWEDSIGNCTCPGVFQGTIWFPMLRDKDCPEHGNPSMEREER